MNEISQTGWGSLQIMNGWNFATKIAIFGQLSFFFGCRFAVRKTSNIKFKTIIQGFLNGNDCLFLLKFLFVIKNGAGLL